MFLPEAEFRRTFVMHKGKNDQNNVQMTNTQTNALFEQVGRKTILLLGLLLYVVSLTAQGFEYRYPSDSLGADFNRTDEGRAIIQTIDRGYLMVGFSESFGDDNDQDVFVVRTDVDGKVIWSEIFDESITEHGNAVYENPDRTIMIAGFLEGLDGNRDFYLLKVSREGKFIWSQTYGTPGTDVATDIAPGIDGGFVLSGRTDNTFNGEDDCLIIKVDDNGVEEWRRRFGSDKDDSAEAIVSHENGYAVAGYKEAPNQPFGNDIAIYGLDKNGFQKWERSIDKGGNDKAWDIILTSDGHLVLAGFVNDQSDAFLAKYDTTGVFQWESTVGEAGRAEEAISVTETIAGDFAFTGLQEEGVINIDFFLAGVDGETGEELWRNTVGDTTKIDFGQDIVFTHDGGFAVVGYHSPANIEPGGGVIPLINDLVLVKTDAFGNIVTTSIHGTVYNDIGSDACNLDNEDVGLSGWLVKAEKEGATYFASTDENGQYELLVDTGDYKVEVLPINKYWGTCGGGFWTPSLTEFYDTTYLNFPVSSSVDCPVLEVDITSTSLIACETATYMVSYCNKGTTTAEDSYLEVTLDDELTFVSSSPSPTSVDGNLLTFQLGDIAVDGCGSISLLTDVVCGGTQPNQAVEVMAHIYPDSICLPTDPNWDGSDIKVTGECDNGEVRFTIKNEGTAAMSMARTSFIVEDQIIFFQMPFQLGPGESKDTSWFPTDGNTWRIIAPQDSLHPGNSFPTVAVEGCVTGGQSYNTGQQTQFPENDGDSFIAIDVQELETTPSAVVLRGHPKGFGVDQKIAQATDITYTIQFTNVSTIDTVHRLVIRDTLPEYLDYSSVVLGASSHPYDFEIYQDGILKIVFEFEEGIQLQPNGGADAHLSSGFVQFRVAQMPDTEVGTIISNSAAVYFDYQEPVMTNLVEHKVACADYLEEGNCLLVNNIPDPIRPGLTINVTPNPFSQSTNISIDGFENQKMFFDLYDGNGRLIRRESFVGIMTFERRDLPAGVYAFVVVSEDGATGSGKLFVR